LVEKCDCPPGAKIHVDEEGMIICDSCGGWIEVIY